MMFAVVIATGACSGLAMGVYDPLVIMPLSIGGNGARGGLVSATTGGDCFTTAAGGGGGGGILPVEVLPLNILLFP